jgi:acyl-CoA thioester hydrolase
VAEAVEIWRGGVNTWECDEMGHMNVRFYVARFMEGLGGLALRLGLPDAFSPTASSTLLVRDHHIRFLKEAHAGAPLHMVGGVVAMDATSATVLQVLLHTRSDAPCAACITQVQHVDASGAPLIWPEAVRAAAEALVVEIPAHAAPRSITTDPVQSIASLEAAERLGVGCAGRGVIAPQDCDAFGRMRAELFIGRVSDGVSGLLAPVRKAVIEAAVEMPKRVGGAVLEYRLIYLNWPRAGSHIELRSGLKGFDDKTQRMVHWLLDPVTGKPWGVSEAVAVNFDLDTRKIIPIAPAAREALQPFVTAGLGF